MTVRTSLSIAVGFVLLLLNTSCKSTRHVPVETKVAPKPVLTIIPQPKPIDTLAVAIDSLIRLLPQGSEVGVSVYNLTKDRPLYAYRDKKLSRPASTMKLITTITTLSYPEGSKAFSTEVWHTGKIVNDTLQGDIFVRGGMDPEFDNDAMNSLVAQTAKFPFKVLNGHIIGDVSMKDSLYWGLGWMWDDAPYDYQPHLTPLMLHKGLVTVTARPDSIGKPAIVTAFPGIGLLHAGERDEEQDGRCGFVQRDTRLCGTIECDTYQRERHEAMFPRHHPLVRTELFHADLHQPTAERRREDTATTI
jgi:D-alanyl-D-alanine carboxypeptidase